MHRICKCSLHMEPYHCVRRRGLSFMTGGAECILLLRLRFSSSSPYFMGGLILDLPTNSQSGRFCLYRKGSDQLITWEPRPRASGENKGSRRRAIGHQGVWKSHPRQLVIITVLCIRKGADNCNHKFKSWKKTRWISANRHDKAAWIAATGRAGKAHWMLNDDDQLLGPEAPSPFLRCRWDTPF